LPNLLANPFPGLRPFKSDEAYLFFGREKQTDELLRRLRVNRFLGVIGSSGSGKSSLVRCGLIPSLYGGAMSKAGSNWRVATLRPGDDPIARLLNALCAPGILGVGDESPEITRESIEAKLRRTALGLIDAVKLAQLPAQENLLVVVDQFEELFRFRQSRQAENPRDEAIAFVKLLLEAARQDEFPIYVALTMRSDFIGDCIEYPGLPEAINAGLYLVPQMSRDELRSAISGPVAVAGGEVTQRLIQRLLNDVGVEQDQLPLLQHALMRTWDFWQTRRTENQPSQPMDIPDYEAVGTLQNALSLHADEALEETGSDHNRLVAEKLFRALTDTFSDPRGVRRPASISKLVEICGASESDIVQIVDVFRRPGRSFLMPPSDEVPKLTSRDIIDISHESLMRRWDSLTKWAELEFRAASFYVRRLSPTAVGFVEGTAALWRNPDLANAVRWRQENQPTPAWAEQYNTLFPEVMEFLDRSECAETERQVKERKTQQRTKIAAVAFAVLAAIASVGVWQAWRQNARAENNLRYAEDSVNNMLNNVNGQVPLSETPAVPGLEEIRLQSLNSAMDFYTKLGQLNVDSETVDKGAAIASLENAQMQIRSSNFVQAAADCNQAIKSFGALAKKFPSEAIYREELANANMLLGETYRMSGTDPATAQTAYAQAISIFQGLLKSNPQSSLVAQYTRELAQAFCNRGIFLGVQKQLDASKSDYDAAINLLGTLFKADPKQTEAGWDLARACNDRANYFYYDLQQNSPAKDDYVQAATIGGNLNKDGNASPDYKLELAKYFDNLAELLNSMDDISDAQSAANQAQSLITGLSMATTSVNLEQVKIFAMLGSMVEPSNRQKAAEQYKSSINTLEEIIKASPPEQKDKGFLSMASYVADCYMALAEDAFAAKDMAGAKSAVQTLKQLLQEIPDANNSDRNNRLALLQKKLY
jgi:tetratricopeptide (TPR) repeat protein/energy-coupling factor transporter ATP-binding protein EcfA2